MTGFHENPNPYAAPDPVEEDAPGYDLRKIAGLYNRLGWVKRWFVILVVFELLAIAGIAFLLWLANLTDGLGSPSMTIISGFVGGSFFTVWCAVVFLVYFGAFLLVRIAWVMKFRAPAMLLIILGAINFPITIIVWILLRRRAQQIFSNGGVEIINGKVDLTQIPVEEDY